MNDRFVTASMMGIAMLALTGCSSLSVDKVWPFGKEEGPGQPKRLANAVEYQCDGGKRFHVRMANGGDIAWVIYSDREVALSKEGASNRYTNGLAVLEITGIEAVLKEGDSAAQQSYTGCKAAGK